jgi:predicted secreted protein
VSYSEVGTVLWAQGKFPEAMEAYRQDQAIVKRLTDHDKSNPTWQQGLLWIDEKLGEALAVHWLCKARSWKRWRSYSKPYRSPKI